MNRKPGRLSVRWSRRERDILYSYPRKVDGSLLGLFFGCLRLDERTLLEELDARGYDLSTLRFTIDRKPG